MITLKRITTLLFAAALTLSLCTAIISVNPNTTDEYENEGISLCLDDSDFGDVDYF